MRYVCLVYGDSDVFDALSEQEGEALVDEHLAYDDTLRDRGHWVTAEAMEGPETAKVVRMRGGRISATDGPFAETKEQIGGFFVIEAASFDEAVEIAGRIPSARLGSIEIRPVRDLIAERSRRAPPSGAT